MGRLNSIVPNLTEPTWYCLSVITQPACNRGQTPMLKCNILHSRLVVVVYRQFPATTTTEKTKPAIKNAIFGF